MIQMCGFVIPEAIDISSTTFTSCCSCGVCASMISRAPVDFRTFVGPVLYEYFAIAAPMRGEQRCRTTGRRGDTPRAARAAVARYAM